MPQQPRQPEASHRIAVFFFCDAWRLWLKDVVGCGITLTLENIYWCGMNMRKTQRRHKQI